MADEANTNGSSASDNHASDPGGQEKSLDNEDLDAGAQHQLAVLRERMLKLWQHAAGRRVRLRMFDGVVADAVLRAVDAQQTALLVSSLGTPLGVLPNALLRMTDVKSITFLSLTGE
eukprot:jgi/Mesvir1/5494/Mv15539-RA.1